MSRKILYWVIAILIYFGLVILPLMVSTWIILEILFNFQIANLLPLLVFLTINIILFLFNFNELKIKIR